MDLSSMATEGSNRAKKLHFAAKHKIFKNDNQKWQIEKSIA
jgi:hypothetical protein